MRRGVSAVHTRALLCLCASRRTIHRHHSPDRTFSQEIQDRQNAFQWSNRHVFRPHQHFSYDPSNWSRTLEEKTKAAHKLSLVERVKLMQEHEAERTANMAAVHHATAGAALHPKNAAATAAQTEGDDAHAVPSNSGDDDLPSYFFSLEDAATTPSGGRSAEHEKESASQNPWSTVSLQELVEELQRLHHLLYSRRYAGNASLARRAHQEAELKVVVRQLFERLEGATLTETVTVDAAAFGWFLLLRHVEVLAETLVEQTAAEGNGAEAAVRRIYNALQRLVLCPMERGGAIYADAEAGTLSLEALIELLSVAASPFVKNCSQAFRSSSSSSLPGAAAERLPASALAEYVSWVLRAAQQRAQEASTEDGAEVQPSLREWVDPTHLDAWADAVRHLQHREQVSAQTHLPGLMLHVTHAAVYVSRTLESVTGVTLRGRVKESLQRRSALRNAAPSQDSTNAAEAAQSENVGDTVATRVRAPKAVVLDPTAPPRGVQRAPTECEDVSRVLSAATSVLQTTTHCEEMDAAWEGRVRRLVTACLRMAAQAPNYDVEGPVVVRWASTLLQMDVLMEEALDEGAPGSQQPADAHTELSKGAENSVRLHLRLLLLLSRLTFADVVDRPLLGRLVLHLAQCPEPSAVTATERAECRRLRGLVMKVALDRLSVVDLAAAATEVGGVSTWVETLAFGEYDGLVPLGLWRAACQHYLPAEVSSNATSSLPREACTPEVAHALLVLCARHIAREQAGRFYAAATAANVRSFHTAQLVAQCLGVLHGDAALAARLTQSADAWETVTGAVAEPLLPLLSAMQAEVRQATTHTKVKSFL